MNVMKANIVPIATSHEQAMEAPAERARLARTARTTPKTDPDRIPSTNTHMSADWILPDSTF